MQIKVRTRIRKTLSGAARALVNVKSENVVSAFFFRNGKVEDLRKSKHTPRGLIKLDASAYIRVFRATANRRHRIGQPGQNRVVIDIIASVIHIDLAYCNIIT